MVILSTIKIVVFHVKGVGADPVVYSMCSRILYRAEREPNLCNAVLPYSSDV